jgi:hypothetical protein
VYIKLAVEILIIELPPGLFLVFRVLHQFRVGGTESHPRLFIVPLMIDVVNEERRLSSEESLLRLLFLFIFFDHFFDWFCF